MPSVGTRTFWRPLDAAAGSQPEPIVKNSGYLNVLLRGAYYWAPGSLWQRIFGGSDRISLVSTISYHAAIKTVEAVSVQDVRSVPAKKGSYLALGRTVAVRVPAGADAIELGVQLTAIESDNLDTALGLLNTNEARKALELAPPVVGAVVTITGLVKKAFSSIGAQPRLEATYPGIIGTGTTRTPLQENRLVAGYLIVIAVEDAADTFLDTVDPGGLNVVGDGLRYKGSPLRYTYVIYDISFDERRGLDPDAPWADKFRLSLRAIDPVVGASPSDWPQFLAGAKQKWVEGSALLDADPNYIDQERQEIRDKALSDLWAYYQKRTGSGPAGAGAKAKVIRLDDAIAALTDGVEHLAELPLAERTVRLQRSARAYSARLKRANLRWNLEK